MFHTVVTTAIEEGYLYHLDKVAVGMAAWTRYAGMTYVSREEVEDENGEVYQTTLTFKRPAPDFVLELE